MHPQDFYVLSRASRGICIELQDPQGNQEWVRVRSVVSGEFAHRSAELAAQAMRAGEMTLAQRKVAMRRLRAELVASLVAEWSLDADPVEVFLVNPRLRRQIEEVANNHSLHFGVNA